MTERSKAYAAALAVFAADRLTKIWIEASVSMDDTHRIIPGLFDIVHSENRGVAFGFFNDSQSEWRVLLLVAASLAAVIGVGIALWHSEKLTRISFWAFALIMGGAAGNLFDRVIRGRVTDFLRFYWGDHEWPSFNIADSAIVIGCCLLLIDQFRPKRQPVHVP
jgi:signal peptidase II